jgi:3-oxoacyl-[acyl-carrier-protein] synthase III
LIHFYKRDCVREAIKRENISMDEVDKRVLGTSEEKQAMPEEAEKVNQEEQC